MLVARLNSIHTYQISIAYVNKTLVCVANSITHL